MGEGRKMLNTVELNRRMKEGLVNKSVLLKGAKPYNKAAVRKLDEDDAFEITGKYSIQFNNCISMTVSNEDIAADENFIDMAANGDLISEKDYILFNVCETEYCSYYGEDDKMTFIAEVGTYFAAISQYLPTKVEEYCEACEDNYDYCYALSTGQQYYPEGYEPEEDDDYASKYEWYQFEISQEQSDEIGAVCTVYTTLPANDDAAANGGYYTPHTVYNGDNGNLFNYERGNSKNSNGMSGSAIFGLIIMFVAVVGGAVAFMMKKSGGSADKKKPLINENEGTMA